MNASVGHGWGEGSYLVGGESIPRFRRNWHWYGSGPALAKQLKLLLGAKSNIFQVLNKHTIKMLKSAVSPGVFRLPSHPPPASSSVTPSTYIYVVEKKVDSLIFFSRFIYICQDAARRTFSSSGKWGGKSQLEMKKSGWETLEKFQGVSELCMIAY